MPAHIYRPRLKSTGEGNYHYLMAGTDASCTLRPIAGRIIYFGSDTVLDGWDGCSVLNTSKDIVVIVIFPDILYIRKAH